MEDLGGGMKRLWQYLVCLWKRYNPFDIDSTISRIVRSVDIVSNKVDNLHLMIARDIAELEYQNAQKELILQTIIDTLPDMVWYKDTGGRYVYANKAIKEGLLMCANPIGMTDVELATHAKAVFGDENHTFGEKCSNSDAVVMGKVREGTFTKDDGRFMESGKIKGEMKYLEVFKAPIVVEGELKGVCGTGRDLTEYMKVVKKVEGYCGKRCGESDIVAVFKKYEFQEEE
jgi:hypothetical protein